MRKVCKTCKMFVNEPGKCPIGRKDPECGAINPNKLSENWKGRIFVFNAEKSLVAKRAGYKHDGEYAIKVR